MSVRDLLAAQHRSVLEQLDTLVQRSSPRSRSNVARKLRAHLEKEREVAAKLDARARVALTERHRLLEHLIDRLLEPGNATERHERARLLRETLVHWFDLADRLRARTEKV